MLINSNLVRKLRNKTGAGISDCKKALTENNSNIDKSIVWLRKKGFVSAAKRSGRDSSDGVVAIVTNSNYATIIELNSETDFVAKSEKFIKLADMIVEKAHAFEGNNLIKFLASCYHGLVTVQDIINEHITVFGENIVLKKIGKIYIENGTVASYLHNKLSERVAKIGVLVALKVEINHQVKEFAKQIGMHIAAMKPLALSIETLDQKIIENEKNIFRAQVLENNKITGIMEKIVENKMKKFIDQVVLLEQTFVIDGKKKIKKAIEELKTKSSCSFNIEEYLRYGISL